MKLFFMSLFINFAIQATQPSEVSSEEQKKRFYFINTKQGKTVVADFNTFQKLKSLGIQDDFDAIKKAAGSLLPSPVSVEESLKKVDATIDPVITFMDKKDPVLQMKEKTEEKAAQFLTSKAFKVDAFLEGFGSLVRSFIPAAEDEIEQMEPAKSEKVSLIVEPKKEEVKRPAASALEPAKTNVKGALTAGAITGLMKYMQESASATDDQSKQEALKKAMAAALGATAGSVNPGKKNTALTSTMLSTVAATADSVAQGKTNEQAAAAGLGAAVNQGSTFINKNTTAGALQSMTAATIASLAEQVAAGKMSSAEALQATKDEAQKQLLVAAIGQIQQKGQAVVAQNQGTINQVLAAQDVASRFLKKVTGTTKELYLFLYNNYPKTGCASVFLTDDKVRAQAGTPKRDADELELTVMPEVTKRQYRKENIALAQLLLSRLQNEATLFLYYNKNMIAKSMYVPQQGFKNIIYFNDPSRAVLLNDFGTALRYLFNLSDDKKAFEALVLKGSI